MLIVTVPYNILKLYLMQIAQQESVPGHVSLAMAAPLLYFVRALVAQRLMGEVASMYVDSYVVGYVARAPGATVALIHLVVVLVCAIVVVRLCCPQRVYLAAGVVLHTYCALWPPHARLGLGVERRVSSPRHVRCGKGVGRRGERWLRHEPASERPCMRIAARRGARPTAFGTRC